MFALISCEEVIDVELDNADPQIVAEGSIANGEFAEVLLSYSSAYFTNESSATIDGAQISLFDLESGTQEVLASRGDGLYQGEVILGQENHQYRLEIEFENQVYVATATMYPAVQIEKVELNEFAGGGPFGGSGESGFVAITDFVSAGDDVYYQFEYEISDATIPAGYFLSLAADSGSTIRYANPQIVVPKGDTLQLSIKSIDEGTFNYLTGLNDLIGTGFGGGGGASSAPSNPPSNFEANILGYFGAFSISQLDTIAPN